MYIRPTAIATDPSLGVHPSSFAKLYIIACVVGPYYPEGFKAIRIYCTEQATTSYPGGLGHVKVGGNYAATLKL